MKKLFLIALVSMGSLNAMTFFKFEDDYFQLEETPSKLELYCFTDDKKTKQLFHRVAEKKDNIQYKTYVKNASFCPKTNVISMPIICEKITIESPKKRKRELINRYLYTINLKNALLGATW